MTEILEIPKLVTIFGGSGFIGRHVVRALAKRGYRIRVATRRPDLAGHLQPLGNVGQIQPVQANIRVRWSVDRAVEGADHVINLVGILYQSGRQTFNAVQDFGARAVAEAARAAKARLTHGSALGADLQSWSVYARTKARGEKAVQETLKDAVIFRPSIVFGPEDHVLQPLRRHGAVFAGAAADRRRAHALPAGLCRRRRRGDRPFGRRQRQGRPDL